MTKELFVSTTPHETKVGIVEDDQLAEVYFERENEYTLAGSIYKGRVTRVLPGMQSAFVDIGLERDAFLYVSDFFELQDEEGEFQEITVPRQQFEAPSTAEDEAATETPLEPLPGPEGQQEVTTEGGLEPAQASSARERENDQGGRGWRNRRRRRGRRGRGLPESKFSRGPEPHATAPAEPVRESREPRESRESRESREPVYEPIILPGESISKYQNRSRPAREPESHPNSAEAAPADGTAGTEQEHPGPAEERQELEERDQRRFEQMNVAAAFGGEAAEREPERQEEEDQPRVRFVEPQAEPSHSFERQEQKMQASEPAAGTVEEEEIEDEESDMPSFAEELEDTDFEELEEETHEAGDLHDSEHNHIGNGVELTEAVEETDAERAAFAEEFAENG
ncbi:MAG TPA: hypothetical protein VJQ50_18500, partial [Terriglobales bacterium]|nr:hypothetical protein [Terriglobales bacterium]